MEQPEPTVAVSLEMKVNLGNYESAGVFVSVSGLRAGASPAEIDELLDTGRIAYERIRERMKDKVMQARADGQHPTTSGWR